MSNSIFSTWNILLSWCPQIETPKQHYKLQTTDHTKLWQSYGYPIAIPLQFQGANVHGSFGRIIGVELLEKVTKSQQCGKVAYEDGRNHERVAFCIQDSSQIEEEYTVIEKRGDLTGNIADIIWPERCMRLRVTSVSVRPPALDSTLS